MKKPFMKKEDLEKEYFDVSMPVDAICHVPLRQAAKVLGIKNKDLPVIRTEAGALACNYKWLENEKEKGSIFYKHQIENTKDHLIETYPELKEKLKKAKLVGKTGEICRFIDSAIILELNHTMDLDDKYAFLETLH
jgi:hypothetical protein